MEATQPFLRVSACTHPGQISAVPEAQATFALPDASVSWEARLQGSTLYPGNYRAHPEQLGISHDLLDTAQNSPASLSICCAVCSFAERRANFLGMLGSPVHCSSTHISLNMGTNMNTLLGMTVRPSPNCKWKP